MAHMGILQKSPETDRVNQPESASGDFYYCPEYGAPDGMCKRFQHSSLKFCPENGITVASTKQSTGKQKAAEKNGKQQF